MIYLGATSAPTGPPMAPPEKDVANSVTCPPPTSHVTPIPSLSPPRKDDFVKAPWRSVSGESSQAYTKGIVWSAEPIKVLRRTKNEHTMCTQSFLAKDVLNMLKTKTKEPLLIELQAQRGIRTTM